MMKKFWFFISLIILILVGINESRRFICLNDGKCITIWKTFNGCYVIPGKYYGCLKPSDKNYIEATSKGSFAIIWPKKSRTVIVDFSENYKIVNQSLSYEKINDYNSNKTHNDSLFTKVQGHYRVYKDNVEFITVDLNDYFVSNSGGKSE
jgi:hypothetical protein